MRDLFVKLLMDLVPPDGTGLTPLQNFIATVQAGSWNDVPLPASQRSAANMLVDLALARGWAGKLADALYAISPGNFEVQTIRNWLAARSEATIDDPFKEVWLESDRPFIDRHDLRERLRLLCTGSSTTLLVNGQPKSGKSHSFYLAQHVARPRGFITSHFAVADYPQPDKLASEILERLGVDIAPVNQGVENAQRWGEKLAAQIADVTAKQKLPRIFVFDDFPDGELPAGTSKLIVRLAKFADEELRAYLRLVLIQFTAELPPALEDVAEQDHPEPFTDQDILQALQQIATARKWSLSEAALQAEIAALDKTPEKWLRAGFKFLRETIRRLGGVS